jgi:hypothetical protein
MLIRLKKPKPIINVDNLSENEMKELVIKIAEKLDLEINILE